MKRQELMVFLQKFIDKFYLKVLKNQSTMTGFYFEAVGQISQSNLTIKIGKWDIEYEYIVEMVPLTGGGPPAIFKTERAQEFVDHLAFLQTLIDNETLSCKLSEKQEEVKDKKSKKKMKKEEKSVDEPEEDNDEPEFKVPSRDFKGKF